MQKEQNTLIEIAQCKVILRPDSIIQVNATNHSYSVSDVKELHKYFGEITGGKKARFLLIASEFSSIEAETRDYIASNEAGKHSIANAYIIKSLPQRLLMNFLLSVQRPKVPAKFFTDIKQGENWLKQFELNEKVHWIFK